MKTFISALLIFALLVCAIVFNGRYLSQTANTLTGLVDALPDLPDDHTPALLDEIVQLFEKHQSYISLTINVYSVQSIEHHLDALTAALLQRDLTAYTQHRLELLRALSRLAEYDALTPSAIF